MSRLKRGVTLMEILVVLVMMALLATASVRSFTIGVDYQTRYLPERNREQAIRTFELRVRQFFESLTFDADDATTFFVLEETGDGTAIPNSDASADRVTFTIMRKPGQAVLASNMDFESMNAEFGPVGGLEEVSLSTSPVGDAGTQQGLFIRTQSPGDTDFTQGGYESVLWEDVQAVAFEGYDGVNWSSIWDTSTGEARIPAAIRMTYVLRSEPETVRTVTVRLPLSDVTPEAPYGQGAAR